jgi:hypothetical protein
MRALVHRCSNWSSCCRASTLRHWEAARQAMRPSNSSASSTPHMIVVVLAHCVPGNYPIRIVGVNVQQINESISFAQACYVHHRRVVSVSFSFVTPPSTAAAAACRNQHHQRVVQLELHVIHLSHRRLHRAFAGWLPPVSL